MKFYIWRLGIEFYTVWLTPLSHKAQIEF